jgi:uncharacterized protein YegL
MSEVTIEKSWVHIGLLIDRSGSMEEMDTKQLAKSATNLIKEQRQSQGIERVTATVANFDEQFQIISRNKDASNLEITETDIQPRGMTALYTSIGRIINIVGKDLNDMTDKRPGTVVIIVMTDGEQTCHRLRNREEWDTPFEGSDGNIQLCARVKHQEDTYSWKFFMLGTNIDAIKEGFKMGFTPETCINYNYSTEGGGEVIRSTSQAVSRFTEFNTSADKDDSPFEGYTENERISSMN